MVGAVYCSDAVERARETPSLKVGLHLTLVEGRPILGSRQIPDLVDADGVFSTRLARAGFKFFFTPGIRKQLEAEIRAQDTAENYMPILDQVPADNQGFTDDDVRQAAFVLSAGDVVINAFLDPAIAPVHGGVGRGGQRHVAIEQQADPE